MQQDIFDEEYQYKFNPNDIDISVQQISLYYLLRRLEYGELDLFAGYQRHWNLWSHVQQSRLIESILIKIPIPSFYFDSGNDGKWQIVDGLQRVTTFYNFIIKQNFKLVGLEFLPEFNGYAYVDLPRELQRRIEEFPLSIYLINSGTPEDVKFVIFSRINTGGINLNGQELRFALNQGIATRLLTELSASQSFREATFNSVRSRRMEDFELVNRFLAFYLFKLDYKGNLDTFLNHALFEINRGKLDIGLLKTEFTKAMYYTIRIFGDLRFKRISEFSFMLNRVNKSIFDTVSVNIGWLTSEDLEKLVANRLTLLEEWRLLFKDRQFIDSISLSTNSSRKVSYRFEAVQALFKKHT